MKGGQTDEQRAQRSHPQTRAMPGFKSDTGRKGSSVKETNQRKISKCEHHLNTSLTQPGRGTPALHIEGLSSAGFPPERRRAARLARGAERSYRVFSSWNCVRNYEPTPPPPSLQGEVVLLLLPLCKGIAASSPLLLHHWMTAGHKKGDCCTQTFIH